MGYRLAATDLTEQIVAAIRRMIDPDVAIAGWRALAGGTGARCFAVEVAGRRLVAKLADPQALTAISVETEFRLLEHAAGIGVAPAPIGIDRSVGLLLCELVDTVAWLPGDFRASENIVRIADRLRMLHTLPTEIRPYEPMRFADTYVALCDRANRPQAEAFRRELEAQAGFLTAEVDAAVVCHNDLHASNILRGPELMFIDFEYAVAAPPIVDLASLIAMNRFDERESELLVAAYDGGRPSIDREHLGPAVRLHELLADLWQLARDGRRCETKENLRSPRSGVNRE